jgi:anhydro-N-acetylmuramic acid kinase
VRIYTAIGLMSGTSMDGIDAAVVETDGRDHLHHGPSISIAYDAGMRARIARAAEAFRGTTDRDGRPGISAEVEQEITIAHASAIETLCRRAGLARGQVDIVGFHGQTVFHRPEIGLTVQLGNGPLLARLCGIDVVFDMRADDMRAGGQGAPLVPAYHVALARTLDLPRPVAFVNIGGVANITWVPPDGEPVAFDTGPGNALIDDWCVARIGVPVDRDGALAARGRIDEAALARLTAHRYLDLGYPKSLDRGDFSTAEVAALSPEDGAATLAAFTAATIAGAARLCPAPPLAWVVCGGGRRNPAILDGLRARVTGDLFTCEDVGLRGDDIEAEAFAYLAVRSLENLPLTFPGTTGVAAPTGGGRLCRYGQAA